MAEENGSETGGEQAGTPGTEERKGKEGQEEAGGSRNGNEGNQSRQLAQTTQGTPQTNGSQNGGEPEAEVGPNPTIGVNSQIKDAVRTTNEFLLGDPGGPNGGGGDGGGPTSPRYDPGVPIGNEKADQALSFAVQDAVDYQRNVLSISSTAQGKALAMMFKDVAAGEVDKLGEHALIYLLSMVGSVAAGVTTSYIATNAETLLNSPNHMPK